MPVAADKKTVLLTGCTPGGIGHALAMEFHKKGCHVIATARNPAVLQDMEKLPDMTCLQLDVTSASSISAFKEALESDEVLGPDRGLDILVNNAGRTHTIPATDIEMDDVRATFETNVFGVMAMVQAMFPLLAKSRGLIVNIASLAAITPYVFGSVYCSTKGALVSYSRTLRQELAPFGIRVTVAMTGTVRSNTASHGHRSLPPGSPYQRVRDVFTWRLTFSQTNSTYPTEDYARRLVADCLAPESPVWLRQWLGRPDWFWCGGNAFTVWLASFLPEWVTDMVCRRKFKMTLLENVLAQEQQAQKKLK